MAIFTGKRVESVGFGVALASSFLLLRTPNFYIILAGLAVYGLDRLYPKAFNWLANFAEPTTWPGYVALGVAGLAAAHHGGLRADLVIAGLLATGDGRMFDALY